MNSNSSHVSIFKWSLNETAGDSFSFFDFLKYRIIRERMRMEMLKSISIAQYSILEYQNSIIYL